MSKKKLGTRSDLRLVEVKGDTFLAWGYGTDAEGAPLAVIGPNAVQCPRCKAYQGQPCLQAEIPHFERMVEMNKEIKRLMVVTDG